MASPQECSEAEDEKCHFNDENQKQNEYDTEHWSGGKQRGLKGIRVRHIESHIKTDKNTKMLLRIWVIIHQE